MTKKDLSQKVLDQIKQDQIKIIPKWWYLLGTALLSLGLGLTIIITALALGLAILRLSANQPFGYLFFGTRGLGPFLRVFPFQWLILGISGILLGLGLTQHFKTAYRRSTRSRLVWIGTGTVIIALFLALGYQRRQLPGPLNDPIRRHLIGTMVTQDHIMGIITQVNASSLTLLTPLNEEITVTWDESTHLPWGADFESGDHLVVIGEFQSPTRFKATGLRPDHHPPVDIREMRQMHRRMQAR